MFDLFDKVKGKIKLPEVWIDDWVFRLHYKLTFVVLFGSAILVTAKQYLGDPIDCIVEEIPQNVMDTYCWIHSTFSIPGSDLGKEGYDVAHPGVGPPINGQDEYNVAHPGAGPSPTEPGDDDSFRYHKYYQWVALVLFFQALLFYLPHYIWKYLEDGKMQLLAGGLAVPIVDETNKNDRLNTLVDYVGRNKGKHTWYAYKFFVCEFFNLVNIVGQIFFTDFFLGGEFSKYGSEVISISEKDLSDRGDPMDRVFPKVAKCTFHKFGPSGTIEKFDGLCILPLNIINEKIYVFLWFYFIILSVITILHFVNRLAVIFIPSYRNVILARKVSIEVTNFPQDYPDLGDWFVFCLLARNIDSFIFGKFVPKMLKRKGNKHKQGSIFSESISEKLVKKFDGEENDQNAREVQEEDNCDFPKKKSTFKPANCRDGEENIPLIEFSPTSSQRERKNDIKYPDLAHELAEIKECPDENKIAAFSSTNSTESKFNEDPSNEKSAKTTDQPTNSAERGTIAEEPSPSPPETVKATDMGMDPNQVEVEKRPVGGKKSSLE